MKVYARWGCLLVLPCYLLDQWTKSLVNTNLSIGEGFSVVKGFFDIVHVRNTGAAFGLLQGISPAYRTIFFMLITLVACGAILYIFRQSKDDSALLKVVLSLVFAGALGNLTDRLVFNEVVDFISIHVGNYYWPTFNLADTWITVGMAGILIYTFRHPEDSD